MDTLEFAPLNMSITEAGDVPVLSAFLQDALIPPHSFHFSKKNKTFQFFCQRFCWEDIPLHKLNDEDEGDIDDPSPFHRVNTSLCFHHVEAIHHRGLNTHTAPHLDTDNPMNLLVIWGECFANLHHPKLQEQGVHLDPDHTILHLMFSGGGEIVLSLSGLNVDLKDMDHRWPTEHQPSHYDVHALP